MICHVQLQITRFGNLGASGETFNLGTSHFTFHRQDAPFFGPSVALSDGTEAWCCLTRSRKRTQMSSISCFKSWRTRHSSHCN